MTKALDTDLRDKRVVLMMSTTELTSLDAWRHQNRIGSRAEAIRRLVVSGMQNDETEDEFNARIKGMPDDEALRLACGHPLVERIVFDSPPSIHFVSGGATVLQGGGE